MATSPRSPRPRPTAGASVLGDGPIATVTVFCTDPESRTIPHAIHIWSDGHVTTPDHDREPWASDRALIEALGGVAAYSPCDWWAKVSHLVAAEPNLDALLADEEPLRWAPWRQDGRGNTASLYDAVNPQAWTITEHREWTVAAARTAFLGQGINPTVPSADLNLNTPLLGPLGAHRYLRALAHYAQSPVYLTHLSELASVATPDEAAEWAAKGVPWPYVWLYKQLGIELADAAPIQAAASLRTLHIDAPRWTDDPTVWVQPLIDLGVPVDRIAPHHTRYHRSGRWYFREHIARTVGIALEELGLEVPATWIVEAVGAIPDRDTLVDYGRGRHPQASAYAWTRTWADTVACERILQLLTSDGDPNTWPQGWEWPTTDEIVAAIEETVSSHD